MRICECKSKLCNNWTDALLAKFLLAVFKVYSSTTLLLPLYFFANLWFRRNLGSIPLVEVYFVLLAFLIPLACALAVLLCAQVFFDLTIVYYSCL